MLAGALGGLEALIVKKRREMVEHLLGPDSVLDISRSKIIEWKVM